MSRHARGSGRGGESQSFSNLSHLSDAAACRRTTPVGTSATIRRARRKEGEGEKEWEDKVGEREREREREREEGRPAVIAAREF